MSRENSYDEEDESDGPEPEIHAEPGAPEARPNVPRLTLHIDLPDLNPEVIRRAVIEMALNQYVIQQTFVTVKRRKYVHGKDADGNPIQTLVEMDVQEPGPGAFRDVVKDEIAKEMSKLVQPHIRAIMEAQVAEILAGEVQTMNQWGEPKGPKMPIRELIRTTLDGFMREKVDSSGRESPRDGGRTRLEWGIVSASSEVFNSYFKPLVEIEVKAIKADLGARIKDSIAAAVFSHLGLKLG